MSFWAGYPEVQHELERVQHLIDQETAGPGGLISRALSDLTRRDAKFLRPGFVVLAGRIGNGGVPLGEGAIERAAAIEMLHMASLIHDDIVDGARTRRGGDSLHITLGSKRAVLAGDYLFARSFALFAKSSGQEGLRLLTPSVARLVSSVIDESSGLDESPASGLPGGSLRFNLSPRRYLHRIVGKTAVLFALSFHAGALEADTPSKDLIEPLRRVGYNLGVGFQIIDDLLDIAGDPRKTGKPRGTDLRAGVVTLPLILAMQKDSGKILPKLADQARHARWRRTRVHALEEVRRLVSRCGAFQETWSVAERYTRRAEREILRLPPGADRDTLQEATTRLLRRSA
ncbi:heptaprenyl diphosphate synthase [Alkalispirochaeta americana]|uniref:Heptaprenyl diphosphate synthase n=1 Tax=Alkalispirochaeta americana TaxID=159291 RepID=A0A1N6QWC2_9SPIO|nr:polyprenyl synthetase family protein [Alkalispirochaeta americana]SIQ20877.1 heptaprenyl diphosphate synthase [Alkalispirochaeta americana]